MGLLLLTGLPMVPFVLAGVASVATTAALGVFDTSVERDWWEGAIAGTGLGLDMSSLSGSDLPPSASSGRSTLVMCDEVAWEFLALSMASWDALLSDVPVGIWLLAFFKS